MTMKVEQSLHKISIFGTVPVFILFFFLAGLKIYSKLFILNSSHHQSAEARVSASVYTSIHPGTGKGQADGARGDIWRSVTEIQCAVCRILSFP